MGDMSGGWDFSCPDWKDRLAEGRSLIPSLPLNRELANRAVKIFNKLRLPDVVGLPELRTHGGNWQREIPAVIFGSLDRNGRRHVRKLLNLIPKKNNKTTGSAAIMLTALLMDDEPRQSYSLLGATQKISNRAFAQAEGMILADPVLKDRFHIQAYNKTIKDQVTDSILSVQTFDEKIVTGEIPKGALVDELHILGKVHYASRVWGQLWGGMVARPGAFLLAITTQSDEPPAGLFKEELDLARAIRDGRLTGKAANTLPLLYEYPEEIQTDRNRPWKNPAMWPMVLPNLGLSCHLDLLEENFAEAEAKGEAELIRWASQHLNIQLGLGLHAARWRGADYWLSRAAPQTGVPCDDEVQPDTGMPPSDRADLSNIDCTLTLATLLARCEVVTVGIDGGGLDDLFALTVVGREKDTGRWLMWTRAWAVRSVLDLRKDIASYLLDFERDGDLKLVPILDDIIQQAADLLDTIRNSNKLPEAGGIGLDMALIGALVDELVKRGYDAGDAVSGRSGLIEPIAQNAKNLSSAIWTAETKLHGGKLHHPGQGIMTWCVGNAKSEDRGNGVYISKQATGRGKIDPLIAGFNAIKLMERSPVAAGPSESVYATRGLLVL
ncbi:phage terminase large subunit-like protein [Novosphingobium sp. SG751A]|uniref:terminase large subunit domain-containing protein n=1 Tax=Novosphingobium sp. SG751A TaxID=2587000 RepID=UPI0020A6B24C|nr:terminase large subunit [Novosphingobium sp. SG751A]NOW44094.1 phage terminase large subunit-like protein [Novosphingobium sp. SG751A]